MEREAMEKSEEDQSDSSNDEFEAKVRTKEIRRIDPNVLVQFLQGEEKEPEIPVNLRKLKTEQASVEPPYSDVSAKEEEEAIEGESQERTVEDEYEEKVKNRQIRKLKIDNSPFLQKKEDAGDVRPNSKIVAQKEIVVQNVKSNVVESAPPADFDVGDNSDEVFICFTTHAYVVVYTHSSVVISYIRGSQINRCQVDGCAQISRAEEICDQDN